MRVIQAVPGIIVQLAVIPALAALLVKAGLIPARYPQALAGQGTV